MRKFCKKENCIKILRKLEFCFGNFPQLILGRLLWNIFRKGIPITIPVQNYENLNFLLMKKYSFSRI